jgi:hypothetical protein
MNTKGAIAAPSADEAAHEQVAALGGDAATANGGRN